MRWLKRLFGLSDRSVSRGRPQQNRPRDDKVERFWSTLSAHGHVNGEDFQGINLEGADLSGKELKYTNLRMANLMGVNFRGATLDGSDLRGAELEGADFTGAYTSGTIWPSGFDFKTCGAVRH